MIKKKAASRIRLLSKCNLEVKKHELRVKSLWVTNQKSMSYESKVYELWIKSLWVMNQKSMSYDFYWFQSNFNKKTLPQCLFCLSLYMFLYKRWTESPVYITPNISWTIFSQFPHAFPKINNRLQVSVSAMQPFF